MGTALVRKRGASEASQIAIFNVSILIDDTMITNLKSTIQDFMDLYLPVFAGIILFRLTSSV